MHPSLQSDAARRFLRLARLGAFAVVLIVQFAGSPSVRASDDPWKACCQTAIVDDQDQEPPLRRILIDWQRRTLFTGDGHPGELVDADRPPVHSWKRQHIAAALTEFMTESPTAEAGDYFRSIEMTCSPAEGLSGVTRCRAEVPIRIRCTIFVGMPQDRIPVPAPFA